MKDIIFKTYLYSISKGFRLLKVFRYFKDVFKYVVFTNFSLWYRDKGNEIWTQDIAEYDISGEKLGTLKKGLSEKDQKFIDRMFNKIKLISKNNILPYRELFSKDEEKEQKSFAKFYLSYADKYFAVDEVSVWLNLFYKKTLYEIPNVKEKTKNKCILDCGGYIAETAVIFDKAFDAKTIYTFEPNIKNYNRSIETIKHYKLEDKVIPINLGLGKTQSFAVMDGGGAGSKISDHGGGEKISITSIDSFVDKEKIDIGLIKRDIEGMEYESILGAEKTIKQYKPVLLISIYHTGKDFFEIKPLLESWNLGYKFMFLRWNCFHPFADILLVCY